MHEKVENFEQFFFAYKQRINDMEERGNQNENGISRLSDIINTNRSNAEANAIRLEESIERAAIEMK